MAKIKSKKIKILPFRDEAKRQALYIFQNYCCVTGLAQDRAAKPVLLRLVSLVHNPTYYKDFSRFYRTVVRELVKLLKEQGVVSKRVSMKHPCFKEHPIWFVLTAGGDPLLYEEIELFCDEHFTRGGFREIRRVAGFQGVKINWPFDSN